jgi:hypothetical protein
MAAADPPLARIEDVQIEDVRQAVLDARAEGVVALLRDSLAQDDEVLAVLTGSSWDNVRAGQVWRLFTTALVHVLRGSAARDADAGAAAALRGLATGTPAEIYAQLRAFCLAHAAQVRALLRRPNQTNAPERTAMLYPALCEIASREEGAPLALIEIGPGMGFNLCVDRFAYDYGPLGRHGAPGDPDAACRVPFTIDIRSSVVGRADADTEVLRAGLARGFRVAVRIGLELTPVDVMDEAALGWARDFVAGVDVIGGTGPVAPLDLDAAFAVRRATPIETIAGDATRTLPAALAALPPGAIPCVIESYAVYQIPPAARELVAEALARWSAEGSPAYLVSLGRYTVRGDRLSVFRFHERRRERRTAGYCDENGKADGVLVWLPCSATSYGAFSGEIWPDCPF